MKVFLIAISALLLGGCASSYASKCSEWTYSDTFYKLRIGSVEKYDISVCTKFTDIP